jgi:hypothetical protein
MPIVGPVLGGRAMAEDGMGRRPKIIGRREEGGGRAGLMAGMSGLEEEEDGGRESSDWEGVAVGVSGGWDPGGKKRCWGVSGG